MTRAGQVFEVSTGNFCQLPPEKAYKAIHEAQGKRPEAKIVRMSDGICGRTYSYASLEECALKAQTALDNQVWLETSVSVPVECLTVAPRRESTAENKVALKELRGYSAIMKIVVRLASEIMNAERARYFDLRQ